MNLELVIVQTGLFKSLKEMHKTAHALGSQKHCQDCKVLLQNLIDKLQQELEEQHALHHSDNQDTAHENF